MRQCAEDCVSVLAGNTDGLQQNGHLLALETCLFYMYLFFFRSALERVGLVISGGNGQLRAVEGVCLLGGGSAKFCV